MMVTSKAVMACFFDFVRCDLRCGDPVNRGFFCLFVILLLQTRDFLFYFFWCVCVCVTNVYIFSVPFALCLNLNGVHNIVN